MTASGTTSSAAATTRRGRAPRSARLRWWGRGTVTAAAVCLVLTGCSSAPETAAPAASPAASSPAGTPTSTTPGADALTIDIAVADGDVTPNGQKLDVRVGQQVVLNVTSDADDEIHAHTGGDGYELEVQAGKPTSGSFTLDSPGSFEVESHHLEKVIVILNAR